MYRISLIALLFFSYSFGQQQDTNIRVLFREIIGTLANDSMQGRATGSPGIQNALCYLHTEFKKRTGKRLHKQPFGIQTEDSLNLQATNAYCFINNHSKETIIIGAHYDHIGYGGALSKSFTDNQIHNGADDNASGVAMVIALAEALSKQSSSVNYLFVFYSGHEIGLFGSQAFCSWALSKRLRFHNIQRVINFDMIGRMDRGTNTLRCSFFPENDSLIRNSTAADFDIQLKEGTTETLLKLDTKTFVEQQIPSYNFTTGIHVDYHKTTDDAIFINYEGMDKTFRFLLHFLQQYQQSENQTALHRKKYKAISQ